MPTAYGPWNRAPMSLSPKIAGLVVAAGRSRRFGAEKALAEVHGVTLLQRALDRLAPHCGVVGVNSPHLPLPCGAARIEDAAQAPGGPLAGVLAGLRWASEQGAEVLVTLPCDTPLLPVDLVPRLIEAAAGRSCAVARTPSGVESLCAAWRIDLTDQLAERLATGHPPVHAFLESQGCALVEYEDASAFLNVNTPQDLAEAERRIGGT